jgi:hypothetical protein
MPKWAHILEDQNENLRQQNPNLQNMISVTPKPVFNKNTILKMRNGNKV